MNDFIASWAMRGLITVVGLLIALFSWTANTELSRLNDSIGQLWPAITETKNLATSTDKQIGIVSAKVDDLKSTTLDLQGRVLKLEGDDRGGKN